MPAGKVKWFSNVKGYGFIVSEDIPEDLFAHYSAIEMEGYRSLRAGQDVHFEVSEGDKGLHAVNIRAGDRDSSAPAANDEMLMTQEPAFSMSDE